MVSLFIDVADVDYIHFDLSPHLYCYASTVIVLIHVLCVY